MLREAFPKRNVGRLGQLENLTRHHALRDKGGFFAQGEFGRIAPFHEAREHYLEQRSGRSKAFRKAILNKTRNGVVKPVRQGQRSPAFATRSAVTLLDLLEKFPCRSCLRRLCVCACRKFAAVVVGSTRENLFPGLRMRRLE